MPFDVVWDAEQCLLATRVWGSLSAQDVGAFVAQLEAALTALAPGTSFVWLSDATGYDAFVDRAGHQQLRAVLPLALARHGFRTSLLDLYQGAELAVTTSDGVVCRAVAHVHHEPAKMDAFQEQLGRAEERFFSDAVSASAWLHQR